MLRRSLLVGLQMAPQKMTSAITSLHMARYYMLYLLHLRVQRAKKVVSDSLGLVDFAIGLVNSVINLPDGQVKFFEESKLQGTVKSICSSKRFWG